MRACIAINADICTKKNLQNKLTQAYIHTHICKCINIYINKYIHTYLSFKNAYTDIII